MGTSMGCDCSAPKQGEEKLSNEAESQIKPQKRTPSSLSDSNESGANGHSTSKSNKKWYFDPQENTNGNIVDSLCMLIGNKNKQEIENAISSIGDSDKNKNDINAVCEYLLKKVSLDVLDDMDEKSQHECKEGIDGCSSLIGILTVFEIYISWINSSKNKSLYELIVENDKNISDKQILDDFHHLLLNHNNDKDFEIIYSKFENKKLIISIDKSDIIMRNYRDRINMNEKIRKKLYFDISESKEIIFIKLLDRIYCFYVYSFDIGMKLKIREKLKILYATNNEIEDEKERNNSDAEGKKDNKLVCMSSILKNKQINLLNILGKNRIEINRFTTNNININISHEGVIFFYKESEKKDEIIVNEGKEYEEKEWFILAKYKNLKDELMENGKCNIDTTEFNDLQMLSQLEVKSNYNVNLRESYGLKEEHLMALMVYCNFTTVQYELKQTYFRLNIKESDKDFKTRHSIFGNLGSLLKEIIYEYGIECTQKSKINIFYHSIDISKISSTLIRYKGIISTSTSKIVLFNYSNINGTIIELNSGELNLDCIDGKPKYFNCSLISDYPNEDEILFVQQRDSWLELSSIINIKTFESYQLQIFALNIITIAFGDVNESWASDKKNPFNVIPKKQKLKKLVRKVLEIRGVQVQPHLFGKKKKKKNNNNLKIILLKLLSQFALYKREMILFWFSEQTVSDSMWPWMDELLEFMRESCFCKDLKNDNKWVKLDLLSLFFPNLESVTIVGCEITEKILIDIDLFIQKLQQDPKQKAKKKEITPPPQDDPSQVDKLLGIDLDNLVNELHSDKSHISFKDPDFDDLCDYRQCKIKEIKIFESFTNESFVDEKIRRRYNRKFKKFNWSLNKGEIWKGKEGIIIRNTQ